jgi:hypothetical protein
MSQPYANRSVPDGHGTTAYFGSIPKPTKEITVDMLDYGYVEACEDVRCILFVFFCELDGLFVCVCVVVVVGINRIP